MLNINKDLPRLRQDIISCMQADTQQYIEMKGMRKTQKANRRICWLLAVCVLGLVTERLIQLV